jgi:hypothetical protein
MANGPFSRMLQQDMFLSWWLHLAVDSWHPDPEPESRRHHRAGASAVQASALNAVRQGTGAAVVGRAPEPAGLWLSRLEPRLRHVLDAAQLGRELRWQEVKPTSREGRV